MPTAAFNETYLSVHARIFRLALGITGSRTEAEDISQDLYERLWHRRLIVTLHSNPRAYILASARNLCLDRLRSRRPHTEVPASLSCDLDSSSGDDVVAIVSRLVSALPERQRTAMHLRDIEGLDIDEIARIMGSRPDAVRMSLSRAHAAVKEQLTKIMNYGT